MDLQRRISSSALSGLLGLAVLASPAAAQDHDHHGPPEAGGGHRMWMAPLPGGGHLMGMAHLFPAITFAAPISSTSPLRSTGIDFPHSAVMANVESAGSRWVGRLMLNFEGLTLRDGEPTFGGWGEGFIDARHPHTLLHEAMLSLNWWEAPGGSFSLSAGRGFAPYGTDDPMYRPALKYPTNHHLSQILERWTLNASWVADGGWGVEAGIFDGDEPEDPWDMGNFRNFGNSWSARISRWLGGVGPEASWQLSVSYGSVRESHHGDGHGPTFSEEQEPPSSPGGEHAGGAAETEHTRLFNARVRHEAHHGFGSLYGLAEASRSDPEEGDGYFSLLGEAQMGLGEDGVHRPFLRLEYATRPEYPRRAPDGDGFFRYEHGIEAMGATRWLITTAGYGYDLTTLPWSARPFVEISHNRIQHERGPESVAPEVLFGGTSFWSVALGVRLFAGGGPMRMGSYGVLDPMSRGMQAMEMEGMARSR